MEWNEGGILSEIEPLIGLRDWSATEIAAKRTSLLSATSLEVYEEEFVSQVGRQNYIVANVNYHLMQHVQTNLYKCFVITSWDVGSNQSIVGFLHPEGLYDDPKGVHLRKEAYKRLRYHFQFINELGLFPEIAHVAKFSVNVYSAQQQRTIAFSHMSHLFHPSMVDGSFIHDGLGSLPGIKNEDNAWDTRAHRDRIVGVTRKELLLFGTLYDERGTLPEHARLPVLHNKGTVHVPAKLASQSRRLEDIKELYHDAEMWHETRQQKDGTIVRKTSFPVDIQQWILSGPHFYVGTSLNKTPNANCSSHGDYTDLDLVSISDDYLPRTNYVPACSDYVDRIPAWNGK